MMIARASAEMAEQQCHNAPCHGGLVVMAVWLSRLNDVLMPARRMTFRAATGH